MTDDFAFPEIPPQLRPLFVEVMNVVREEMQEPGHRAAIPQVTLMNRIRHAFEGFDERA